MISLQLSYGSLFIGWATTARSRGFEPSNFWVEAKHVTVKH